MIYYCLSVIERCQAMLVTDRTGPSFEPEGHGLHVFKTRAPPVTTRGYYGYDDV